MRGFLTAKKKIGCGEWGALRGSPSDAVWYLFVFGFGVAPYFRLRDLFFFYLMNQKNLLYNDSNEMSFIML